MTQKEQPPRQIGIQSNSGGDITIASPTQIAGRDIINHPPPPNSFAQIGQFLWRHKSALLGVALLCGIVLYPLFPLIVNLIAENIVSSPFLLLILALLGISCFEIIPLLFGAVFGPWIGFIVGFVGVLLSGLLVNALAAYDFPAKVQAPFDLSNGQSSRIGFLVLYSLLIGVSALFTSFKARRKTVRELAMIGGISLLVAVCIYLLVAQVFSQVALSFSALYPLLAISDQTQVLGEVVFAVLLVLVCLLLLILSLLSRYTARISNRIRIHKWWRCGALIGTLAILVIPPIYEFHIMQIISTDLQGQDLPLDIPLNCISCNYPYFNIRLEGIESQNNKSRWDITLINPGTGPCIAVAFLPQNDTLTDVFSHVYQPISFSGLEDKNIIRIDSGRTKIVSLFYQIVPKSAQHFQLAFSLHLTSCKGGRSGNEEAQGSQMLLFQ